MPSPPIQTVWVLSILAQQADSWIEIHHKKLNRTWKWCLESKFAPPLSFKLCIFLKTHFFWDGTFPSFFWEMFWPIFCSNLILQQCLDPLWRWSLWHFLDRTSFFDAGNLTRLLSFQKAGFHLVNRQRGGQPIFGGGGSPMILVPHRCCFHFLFRSTTFPFSPPRNKAPQRTKSHRRTASATPSKAKVAYKHTQRRVHLNCWTPSLHSLKLGFS